MRGVVVFVVVGWAAPVAAEPARSAADIELDARFHAEVARISPTAAEAYDRGNTARDAKRYDEALAAYRRAIELAPNVDHPHRRACGMLGALKRDDEAVAECERALALVPDSPYDKGGLATALAQRREPGDLERGLQLARDAEAQLPASDPHGKEIECQLLVELRRIGDVRACFRRLIAADPNGLFANYLGAVVAGNDRDFVAAKQHLEAARAAGLDDETYRQIDDAIAHDRGAANGTTPHLPLPNTTIVWAAFWTFAIWLGVMAILLFTGYALSRVMLRAVGRATGTDAGTGTDRERRLRKVYKAVLAMCGIYFYLSLPILLVTIVVAGVGAVLVFVAAGVIPIKLVLIIGVVVVATVGAIVRSLFVRGDRGSLGYLLELESEPRLRALLADVASVVGTRSVDTVYLNPGTDLAVTERGGLWGSIRGKRRERALLLGIGLFDGMTQVQLRSILAHEHGHFRNEDTAGGGFAIAVRRSLFAIILRLARSGAAGWYNPVWWFLRGYHRIYLGISQGASRLQEVLADRWAVQAYGTAAFVAGYRHVVARSVAFDREVDATITEVVDAKQPLPNLYQYRAQSKVSEADLASAIDKEMTREPSAYDSHPSPRQRIAWAEALAVAREPQLGDDEPIWALFDRRDALERAMTAEVRKRILQNTGIAIADQQQPPSGSPGPSSTRASG